jgi:hypothetical protein
MVNHGSTINHENFYGWLWFLPCSPLFLVELNIVVVLDFVGSNPEKEIHEQQLLSIREKMAVGFELML